MNYKLVQRALDHVATEFDHKGYKDLADKVDHYCALLETADSKKRKLIAKALNIISREASKRDTVKEHSTRGPTHNRASALRRKISLRKRMQNREGSSKLANLVRKYDGQRKDLRNDRRNRLAR